MAVAVVVTLPSRSVLGKRKAASSSFLLVQPKIDDSESEVEQWTSESASRYSDEDSSEDASDGESDASAESASESEPEVNHPSKQTSHEAELISHTRVLRVQGGASASSSKTSLLGPKSGKRPRRYVCTYAGCAKAYSRPVRLAEHERSHTGERPYKCDECGQSYIRDTHLAAHIRTHKLEEEKPFRCNEPGCGKRVWTSTKLREHVAAVHKGDRPFSCDKCEEKFAKHAQLRRHITVAHCPPGTMVFLCAQEGCEKSFASSMKLKRHERTHEPDRYACSHIDCLAPQTFFPTWSALQAHMRDVHPPTCPYAGCAGRTFARRENLKAHMKAHEEEGDDLGGAVADEEEVEEGRRKRRKNGGEFKCDEEGCAKSFRSTKALGTHKRTAHLGLRPFHCDAPDCGYACGYKHVLQRHVARHHSPVSPPAPSATAAVKPEPLVKLEHFDTLLSQLEPLPALDEPPPEDVIAYLTGTLPTPDLSSSLRAPPQRVVFCPFPDLLEQPFDPEKQGDCPWSGRRVYDLWRHLRAEHGFDCERAWLDEWVGDVGRR